MKTVLVIDDNQDYVESVRTILEREGFEVFDTDCPDAAYQLLTSIDPPDLILCDLHMPFTTTEAEPHFKTSFEVGIKTARELSGVYPETPVVALTSLEQHDLLRIRRSLGTVPAFTKPFLPRDLLNIVKTYLSTKEWGGVQ